MSRLPSALLLSLLLPLRINYIHLADRQKPRLDEGRLLAYDLFEAVGGGIDVALL